MKKRGKRVKVALNLLKRIAATHVINEVCREYSVLPKEALSKTMRPEMLEARQTTVYALRTLGLNVREISEFTGIHFTSVSRHIKRVQDIASVDKAYAHKIGLLHFSIIQKHVYSPTLYEQDEKAEPKTEDFRGGVPG